MGHTPTVHLVELPIPQRQSAAGQMVNDLLSGHGGRQAVGTGHVADDQSRPQRLQLVDFRGLPHQTRDLVAPRRQRGDKVHPDEAACSGNQDLGHELPQWAVNRPSLATRPTCYPGHA